MNKEINATGLQVSLSDSELLALVARGNQAAFQEIYRRYHSYLYTYIYRLTGENAVAEELLQETFVAVWKGASRFRGRAQVKTWLFRIAHNQAVSWLRGKAAQISLEVVELTDGRKAPELLVMESIDRETIQEALSKLSPEHRAVVELAFYFEMSYKEIATVMDCPEGTVKSRMSYARQHLAGVLLKMGLLNNRD